MIVFPFIIIVIVFIILNIFQKEDGMQRPTTYRTSPYLEKEEGRESNTTQEVKNSITREHQQKKHRPQRRRVRGGSSATQKEEGRKKAAPRTHWKNAAPSKRGLRPTSCGPVLLSPPPSSLWAVLLSRLLRSGAAFSLLFLGGGRAFFPLPLGW